MPERKFWQELEVIFFGDDRSPLERARTHPETGTEFFRVRNELQLLAQLFGRW